AVDEEIAGGDGESGGAVHRRCHQGGGDRDSRGGGGDVQPDLVHDRRIDRVVRSPEQAHVDVMVPGGDPGYHPGRTGGVGRGQGAHRVDEGIPVLGGVVLP